jgi:hypothetical protein
MAEGEWAEAVLGANAGQGGALAGGVAEGVGAGHGGDPRAMGLAAFVTWLTPAFTAPTHLLGWCGLVERARSEGVRAMCSVPVRLRISLANREHGPRPTQPGGDEGADRLGAGDRHASLFLDPCDGLVDAGELVRRESQKNDVGGRLSP